MDSTKYSLMPFNYKLARFSLILRRAYPFLGELCARVNKYRVSKLYSMAATDGYNLYLDSESLSKLPEEALNFILLHELFHIILQHKYSKNVLKHERIYCNIAFDLVANWLIMRMEAELKYNKLPIIPVSGTCLSSDDLSLDPSNKIAESFLQQARQQGVLSSGPPLSVFIQWKSFKLEIQHMSLYACDVLGKDEFESFHTDADVQELLSSCRKSAGLGGLPVPLRNLVEEALRGRKLPWYLLLKQYLEAIKDDDFDFIPPDKRMLYSGMILPDSSENINALNNALIVLDVSSSVGRDELLAQIWQIYDVLSDLEFSGSIIAFAGEIHQEAPLTDKLSLKKFIDDLKTGGGTDWAEVVKYVKRQKQIPKPIVVFTDGYFYSFTEGLANVIFITQGEFPNQLKSLGKVVRVN